MLNNELFFGMIKALDERDVIQYAQLVKDYYSGMIDLDDLEILSLETDPDILPYLNGIDKSLQDALDKNIDKAIELIKAHEHLFENKEQQVEFTDTLSELMAQVQYQTLNYANMEIQIKLANQRIRETLKELEGEEK